MKKMLLMPLCWSFTIAVWGQKEQKAIQKGIEKYKEGKYEEAALAFEEILAVNDSNRIARYDQGLAYYKANQKDKAAASFDRITKSSLKDDLFVHSLYNKGVLESENKNWPACIAAFREALRMRPGDDDIRYNLEKALEEYKKSQKQSQEKQKQQERKNQASPKEAPPANKKMMEQWLQSLRQKEQEIQRKMQQKNRTASQPEKDW